MKYILPLLLIVFLAGTLFAGAFLDFFQGRSDGNNISLEWKTRGEQNIVSFEIQRKAGYEGDYMSIVQIDPKGSNSYYSYVDRSAYKSSASVYIYRLKINEGASAPASFSNEITVSHSVSSIKRTWGSIKAMFR
jgi:hypothetical protein